jgi:hypothetical protein
VTNQLNISNGVQVVNISAANFHATGGIDAQILFTVNNVQNGYFTVLSGTSSAATVTFTQAQVQSGLVQFHPTEAAPSYSVIVSNGISSTAPEPASVVFQNAPVIQHNAFNITQGATTLLTTANLNVTVTDGSMPDQVVLQITDLQNAVISSVTTSTPITSFTLTQLLVGDVQLTQDGSAITPSFTVVVTGQTSVSSTPSTSTTQFTNAQGIIAPRLLQNYLKVTQGQSSSFNTQYVQASLGNGSAVYDTTVFFVTNVNHGIIVYATSPSVSLPFFYQSDLQSGTVQFVHDGSPNTPSYQLCVQAQGLRSANIPASIFFQTVPFVANLLTEQQAVAGQPFTYAIPANTFQSTYGQPLTLSTSISTSTVNNSQTSVTFDQFSNRLTGTFQNGGLYDIEVTATDPFNFSAKTDFVVRVLPPPAHSTTLSAAIIGSVVPGVISLVFFCIKTGLQHVAHKKLQDGKDAFDKNVISPIAEAILGRVKMLGPLDKVSTNSVEDFKGAVRTLVTELNVRGVDVRIDQMDSVQRDALINEIATQTKSHVTGSSGCCAALSSMFTVAASPDDLRRKASAIANTVAEVHSARYGNDVPLVELSSSRRYSLTMY